MNDNTKTKCTHCGNVVSVSKDGWMVDRVVRDERGNPIYANGKVKREQQYTNWNHVVGHYNKHLKPCTGSGVSTAGLKLIFG